MAVQIQIRRDNSAAWTAANPTLAQGELGWETDTFRAKVGDGTTAWNSLAYRFEGGGGGGDIAVEHDNVELDPTVSRFDFAHGLDVVSDGATEVNVTVDETELDFSGSHMNIGKSFALSGDISATITGDTDNWAPSGLADASIIYITTNTPGFNLTGITGGADGRALLLVNLGASFLLTLKHDVTSTAANRFLCPGSQDFQLDVNTSALLVYDSGTSRWRVITAYVLSNSAPQSIGTAAAGTSTFASRSTHVHNASGDTPSTQAFGDSPVTGSNAKAAQSDHKHGFPAFPVDLTAAETFSLTGDITPAQITADTDNYAPSGLADATVLRLSTDATRTLTGLTGGADGRYIIIENVGSFVLVLAHDTTSTAANRFLCPGSLPFSLDQNTAVVLVYDATVSRWRILSTFILGTTAAQPVGTATAGTSTVASRQDHAHATGAGTPSTQAFGDAASTGSGPSASMTDHKHAMPTDPTIDLTVDETISLLGDITPAQITATQNNYNPSGLADATILRLSSDATRAITGIEGGTDGRTLILQNVGSFVIRLDSNSGASDADNQFAFPRNTSIYLNTDDTLAIVYDGTSQKWRQVGQAHLGEQLPVAVGGTADDGGQSTTEAAKFDHVHSYGPGNIITPAQITSDQTDYNPSGFSTADVVYLSSDATGRKIHSLATRASGTRVRLVNVGTFRIYLMDNSATGTAAQKFDMFGSFGDSSGGNGARRELGQGMAMTLIYNGDDSRWNIDEPPINYQVGASPLYLGYLEDTQTGTKDPFTIAGFLNEGAAIFWNGASTLTINTVDVSAVSWMPGAVERTLWIFNKSTAQNIVLKHDTGTGSFRMALPGAVDYTIGPRTGVQLMMNQNSAFWFMLGNSAAATAAGGSVSFATLFKWGI